MLPWLVSEDHSLPSQQPLPAASSSLGPSVLADLHGYPEGTPFLPVRKKPWSLPSSGSTSDANEPLCTGLATDTLGPFTFLSTLSPSRRAHMEDRTELELSLGTLDLGLESPVE